jgi:hypothetical protein
MSNSPDLSPMDYGQNVIFKELMFWKKPKDLVGLKRSARQVWKNFPLSTCYNVMKSWRGRVELMLKNQGSQIENLKK